MEGAASTTGVPASRNVLQTTRPWLGLWIERAIVGLHFVSSTTAIVLTVAIFWTMAYNGWEFFREVPLLEFFTDTVWAPDFFPRRYGILPLLKGTFQIAIGATLIGVPLGVGAALYISEFASPRARRVLKPALEVLAGIPSIVFGLVALFIIAPVVQKLCGGGLFTALSATIALGVMVIPIISAISEDALRAVPMELRHGAMALGSTQWETTYRVVLPAARSGISAATILGFSRAVGETMVVTLAAGLIPTLTWSYCEPAQTITSFIANRAGGDLPTGSIEYLSIFAIGLVLFAITFVINIIAEAILARHRRRFA